MFWDGSICVAVMDIMVGLFAHGKDLGMFVVVVVVVVAVAV